MMHQVVSEYSINSFIMEGISDLVYIYSPRLVPHKKWVAVTAEVLYELEKLGISSC